LYEGTLKKPKGDKLDDWKPRNQLLFRSSKFNDDSDRPLKKSSGEWTYFANDIAYHYDKITRNFHQLINVWGADHIGYIKRMQSMVDILSNKKFFLDIRICQIIRLLKNGKIVKMSKRDGNFVTLKEVFNQVGKDPLRYYMISTKNETSIDFDINKVIEKNNDNQVFYCQYAFARASSVINKAVKINEFKEFKKQFINFDKYSISKYEREIILKIISWPYILIQSVILKQPHKITNYIEDLSAHFHSFWNRGKDDKSLRFIDISNSKKTISKLLWIESMRIVFKDAFKIIGIDAHEEM
jgi:arginyl-tRNA synthetase